MSSQSRNSAQALKLAIAAALLAGSAAQAADQPRTFELTAFSDGVGGTAILSGDYNTAAKELGAHASSLDPAVLSTNRCVAYMETRQLEAAHSACDAAVRDAKKEMDALASSMTSPWSRSDYREYLAVAYSNRAVLNWVSKDAAAAQADLKKAAAVDPSAKFVARNQVALESHDAVAQVSVVPKS